MGLLRINKALRGSILEPIVAIVIMVTTIAMAFSILAKVNIVPEIQALNKANEMVNHELFLVYTQNDFLDKEYTDGAFTLVKEVQPLSQSSTITIKISVKDAKGKSIVKKFFQVYNKDVSKIKTE